MVIKHDQTLKWRTWLNKALPGTALFTEDKNRVVSPSTSVNRDSEKTNEREKGQNTFFPNLTQYQKLKQSRDRNMFSLVPVPLTFRPQRTHHKFFHF